MVKKIPVRLLQSLPQTGLGPPTQRRQTATSIKTFGNPSRYEGRQTMLAWANTAGISARLPHHFTGPA